MLTSDSRSTDGRKSMSDGSEGQSLLRFVTCGSVDDGKSTLIGQLLYEAGQIPDDQMRALLSDSKKFGTTGDAVDFALLVDGLESEREQGITIDVAYRYFSTMHRSFIVADTPGHEQYTRNMATGASNSELAILLVDARKGIVVQTRRHAFICSLLGIRHVLLAVNKIDLVDYDPEVFARIVADFKGFARELNFASVTPIPLCARDGVNVSEHSSLTPWYSGPPLIEFLETCDVEQLDKSGSFRFSVQRVARPDADFRGFSGTPSAGQVCVGEDIISALSGRASKVARIVAPEGELERAGLDDSVTIVLSDEIDISRGDMLCHADDRPQVADQFAAHMIWMSEEHLFPQRSYMMRIGDRWVLATVTAIKYKIDVDSFHQLAAKNLELNEVGVCNLSTASPVAFDPYVENRKTGSFILVDRVTNETVAAGMIQFGLRRATNIHVEELFVEKEKRAASKHQKPTVLWFTGLSGSGKSTVAKRLEKRLHDIGQHTYVLDGDNVRHGLNRDLGFTDTDRIENIRRIGEVAKLFTDAGLIVLCSFISPFRAEREMVRKLHAEDEFIEVFVDAPILVCADRDPKGLYAKAKAGKIKNFTGIDSAYEEPEHPELHLHTDQATPDQLVDQILSFLRIRNRI